VSDQALNLLQQMDDSKVTESESALTQRSSALVQEPEIRFPLGGRTGRLDFQLQPNVIDSEYVSAVLAHSSYFSNTDVIDYTIDLTRNKTPPVIDLTDGGDTMAVDP
jgi:hypothetical protein